MTVGLIVNPLSSKDIRRLVALGRVIDVEEKANLVARFLVGVGQGPPTEVLAVDDRGRVARRGLRLAGPRAPAVSWLPLEATGTELDTVAAATALGDVGAAVVAVVGGDGTVRAAVEGWAEIPLLVLPAGTNNAFGAPVEPTVAGLAAAHASSPEVASASLRRRLRLLAEVGQESVTAVVDVVATTDRWVASRALWRPEHLVEAVVTIAHPGAVGMAGVAAAVGPLEEGRVRHLRFGPGRLVRAVFGPGLVVDVSLSQVDDVAVGRVIPLDARVGVLALDGERCALPGGAASVVARPGPFSFDPAAALAASSHR